MRILLRLSPVLLLPLVFCEASLAQTDALPRHGVIGLQVAPPDLTVPEDPAKNPPTIKLVAPGSAGEAAGILAGDVILSLDDSPITGSAEFAHKVSRHLAGDTIKILLVRNGKQLTVSATLKPRPPETSSVADVVYTSISADGVRRSVLITKPKSPGRHPAVLLIGGLGCYSLDGVLTAETGYGPILNAVAKNDFVTMRVEKIGEGDSDGPPCTDPRATADLEAHGYVAGLRLLKSLAYVDSSRIFVFAHSLGPLLASLVLPQEPVRGFIAAETIGRSWFEYSIENLRRQAGVLGEAPDKIDAEVLANARCAYRYFVEHQSSAEISKGSQACAEMMQSYTGLSDAYLHQIGDISLGAQWKNVDIPVLVLYGTSDPATSADEGRYLTSLINAVHPGRATYVELPRMGHDFALYDSQLDFMNRTAGAKPHPYDDEALAVILKWLSEHLAA